MALRVVGAVLSLAIWPVGRFMFDSSATSLGLLVVLIHIIDVDDEA
jgi:hypothetical protein